MHWHSMTQQLKTTTRASQWTNQILIQSNPIFGGGNVLEPQDPSFPSTGIVLVTDDVAIFCDNKDWDDSLILSASAGNDI